jgi:hypothetical protein
VSNEQTFLENDWWPAPVPQNVVIGSGSYLFSSYCFLHYRSEQPTGVKIGSRSGAYEGTFFNLGPLGQVEIGNYCTLAGPTFATNGKVVIGDYAFISYHVYFAGSEAATTPLSRTFEKNDIPDPITVSENVWIGARAVLLPGARLGEGAIIGACAVVDFEVPPFGIVAGSPAEVVGQANPSSKKNGSEGFLRPAKQ